MSWLSKTLGVLQKKRYVTAPLAKAQKVDDKLRDNLINLSEEFGKEENSQGSQLQLAMKAFYARKGIVKGIQAELANMGEQIAVEEKVTMQLLKVESLASKTAAAFRQDWALTKEHLASFGTRRATANDIAKVKTFAATYQGKVREIAADIQALQHPLTAGLAPGERSRLEADNLRYQLIVTEAAKKMAELKQLKDGQAVKGDIGKRLGEWLENVKAEIDKVSIPAISQLRESPNVQQFRKLMSDQLRATEGMLLKLNDEIKLFEKCGLPLMKKSDERMLSRGLSMLARVTE
jgi:hypothetical protein